MGHVSHRFGLSTKKDGGYSKLIVACSALLSGFTFGFSAFQNVLTASWKGSYGLPQSTASLHQRLNQTFLYFGAMFLSAFYAKLTPRQWLTLSTVFSLVGYLLIYFANWWPVENFIYSQIVMGILSGIGAGFSFGIICITPQNWLDETRNKWNPYLFIGAPIFISALVPFTSYLSTVLGWTGALLIMVGIFFHQAIVATLFHQHSSEIESQKQRAIEEKENKVPFCEKVRDFVSVLKYPGIICMIINCMVCSGFIMSAVFTEVTNIAIEMEINPKLAENLILFSAIPEVLFRPLWGELTKCFGESTLQFAWTLILLASQVAFTFAEDAWMFIIGMILFSLGLAGYSGLKYVILIDLVGGANLNKALFFDQMFDAIMTFVVPTISNLFIESMGTKKVLFIVNTFAAALTLLTSWHIHRVLKRKKENKKESKDENENNEENIVLNEKESLTKED
ncbi:unnamed protein product [Oikopleura dioica]|uniref:Major facilitator superfamily (MFS) profile domain-containing protein n=1 Tax=Oikopleura dioica TaxID=34765 RepID=E4YWU0_OIKDI|nr:unnamed protein product [Oikopleura dioica]